MSARVERVVVGVDGSEGSIAALEQAAQESLRHGAQLCPVLAWSPPGGESCYAVHPAPPYVHRQWAEDARKRLVDACEIALRDVLDDLTISPRVIRGDAGPALIACSARPNDMLVVGVSGHRKVHRLIHRSARRHCLKHAQCPVLVVHSEPSAENPADAAPRGPVRGEPEQAGRPQGPTVVPISPLQVLAGGSPR